MRGVPFKFDFHLSATSLGVYSDPDTMERSCQICKMSPRGLPPYNPRVEEDDCFTVSIKIEMGPHLPHVSLPWVPHSPLKYILIMLAYINDNRQYILPSFDTHNIRKSISLLLILNTKVKIRFTPWHLITF